MIWTRLWQINWQLWSPHLKTHYRKDPFGERVFFFSFLRIVLYIGRCISFISYLVFFSCCTCTGCDRFVILSQKNAHNVKNKVLQKIPQNCSILRVKKKNPTHSLLNEKSGKTYSSCFLWSKMQLQILYAKYTATSNLNYRF